MPAMPYRDRRPATSSGVALKLLFNNDATKGYTVNWPASEIAVTDKINRILPDVSGNGAAFFPRTRKPLSLEG
jgi:hypothetical protein